MKSLLTYIELWKTYPIIAGVLTIIGLFFIIKYRKNVKLFLSHKFPYMFKKLKKTENLSVFCDDVQHVFIFKDHVVIPSYKTLYDSLLKRINKERKNGEVLVLDLSRMKTFNVETEEAIRDAIRDIILNNNIRSEVVFPEKGLDKLYSELVDLIYRKDSRAVKIYKRIEDCYEI